MVFLRNTSLLTRCFSTSARTWHGVGSGAAARSWAGPLTSRCVRALQRETDPVEEIHCLYYVKRFNKLLALAITEAGKSMICCVRAGDAGKPAVNLEAREPESRCVDSSPCPKAGGPGAPRAGEDLPPTQTAERRASSSFLHRLVLFEPLTDWMMPAHVGEGGLTSLLSLWIRMLISSRNIPTDRSTVMFDRTPRHPTAQSSRHIK